MASISPCEHRVIDVAADTSMLSGAPPTSIVDAQADNGFHPSRTPLLKLQLLVLFYVQLAEPIASTVIYPFVNQLVRETGITKGDERKTGYFAG